MIPHDLNGLLNLLRQQKLDVVLADLLLRGQEKDEFIAHGIGTNPLVLIAAKKKPPVIDASPGFNESPPCPFTVFQTTAVRLNVNDNNPLSRHSVPAKSTRE